MEVLMDQTKHCVGIDVAKANLDVALSPTDTVLGLVLESPSFVRRGEGEVGSGCRRNG